MAGGPSDVRGAWGVQVNQPGAVGTQHNHYYLPPKPAPPWPLQIGELPALATAFQTRSGLRRRVELARKGSTAVVLTQVLSGGGGVGKSQLAAFYAVEAVRSGTDLVLWVNATGPDAIISAYATAAERVTPPASSAQTQSPMPGRSWSGLPLPTGRGWSCLTTSRAPAR